MAVARDSTCPTCGVVYDDMRTGLTYSCIYSMLWSANPDQSQWRYKRRHTVLGLWHQIKREQWYNHLDWCEELKENQEEREAITAADLLPDEASEVPQYDWYEYDDPV